MNMLLLHMLKLNLLVIPSCSGLNLKFASDRKILSNLIYIKVPKTASSTMGGVVRRIAAHHGIKGFKDASYTFQEEPGMLAHHEERKSYGTMSLQRPIFWLSMIREPADRCLSQYYHVEAGHKGGNLTTASKIQFMRNVCRDYQCQYLTPERGQEFAVETIMQAYDFIGAVEDFDESMVLFASKLGATISDVLYIKSKDSKEQESFITHVPVNQEDEELQSFVRGEFRELNACDYALYENVVARNKQAFKSAALQAKLAEYSQVLHTAHNTCKTNCTLDVVQNRFSPECKQECYWRDGGCAYACLDMIGKAT